MEQHLIEDAVWQRMLSALEAVPYMHCHDLDQLRRFISACFLVMRTNLTWAELGGLVPSAEATKKRCRASIWTTLSYCLTQGCSRQPDDCLTSLLPLHL